MKFHRFVTTAIVAIMSSIDAFTPARQISGATLITPSSRSILVSNNNIAKAAPTSPWRGERFVAQRSGTRTGMILERLFGSAGGGGIVYENLDHPGPELATAAKAGIVLTTSPKDPNIHIATFAGGCFWGLELAYQRVVGVTHTAVGYCQGSEQEPTYSQVCSGATGHTEAVVVYYDPKECTYEQLLDTFFERVNPTTVNGQGNDFGKQYRTGVYPHTSEQMSIAKKRFELEQAKYSRPIATELLDARPFWPAEKYHQQYLEKGGRMGNPQNASKGATEPIRCYG